jgi:hypothetical protein
MTRDILADDEEDVVSLPFMDHVIGAAVEFWSKGCVWCEPMLALEVVKFCQYTRCEHIEDAVVRLFTLLVAENAVDAFVSSIVPARLAKLV